MTDAAYSRRLAQANSLRIRQGSLLTDNGMVAPGGRHASLIPSLPFARGIAASVQYRGNLVVAVANSHTTDDIQHDQPGRPRPQASPAVAARVHRAARRGAEAGLRTQCRQALAGPARRRGCSPSAGLSR